jgi:hypothetical protein
LYEDELYEEPYCELLYCPGRFGRGGRDGREGGRGDEVEEFEGEEGKEEGVFVEFNRGGSPPVEAALEMGRVPLKPRSQGFGGDGLGIDEAIQRKKKG